MHRRQVSTAAAGLLPARQPRAGIGCFSANGKIVPLPLLPFPLKNPYFFFPLSNCLCGLKQSKDNEKASLSVIYLITHHSPLFNNQLVVKPGNIHP